MQVFLQVPKVARHNSQVLKQLTVVVLMVEFVVLLVVSVGRYRSVWDHLDVCVNYVGGSRAIGYRLQQRGTMDTSKCSPCCIFQVHPPGILQLAIIIQVFTPWVRAFHDSARAFRAPVRLSFASVRALHSSARAVCAPVREQTSAYSSKLALIQVTYTPWVRARS